MGKEEELRQFHALKSGNNIEQRINKVERFTSNVSKPRAQGPSAPKSAASRTGIVFKRKDSGAVVGAPSLDGAGPPEKSAAEKPTEAQPPEKKASTSAPEKAAQASPSPSPSPGGVAGLGAYG